jgi:hypothetical protein
MLGDGTVSFGTAVVVCCLRKAKASPKIVSCNVMGACTCSAAVANSSVPCSL